MESIDEFLEKRRESGNLRTLSAITTRKNGRLRINRKNYIDLSSNDYLGLSGHPQMIAAAQKAMKQFGTGSCASRLLSGSLKLHHILEEKTAAFKNKESALIFNSGYQANLGILPALYSRFDAIFADKLSHASLIDGIALSQAKLFRFRHNDLNHLEEILKNERKKFKQALIVTESIFSMDGDRADLKNIVAMKEKYDCQMMIDEAHATGIYGKTGAGLAEEAGLSEKIELIMGTFSKALGSFGAYLAASKKITQYLINTCRSFIYSTALPPAVIACNIESLNLVKKEPWRRKELLKCADFFRTTLKERGFNVKGSSQIVPLILGDTFKAIAYARRLQDKGYWVMPIRPPTVPDTQARLRFSLTTYHKQPMLQRLIDELPKK